MVGQIEHFSRCTKNKCGFQGLGQRLVRRNFLRFGKRSGPASPAAGPGPMMIMHPGWPQVKRAQVKRKASGEQGEGEQYEASVMSGQHPHKSNTRSFLRFGKRADNFLRFGKSSMAEVIKTLLSSFHNS